MQKVVDGVLVTYEQFGHGNRDLVFMHGWGGSLQNWLHIAKQFDDRYRVTLFDFPGLGGSSMPKSSWDIYDYSRFAHRFLTGVGVKSAILIGHSFGGRVAIILGAQEQNFVDRLVLVDAAGMEIKSWKAFLFGSVFTLPIRMVKPFMPESLRKVFRSPDYQAAGRMRDVFAKVVDQNLRRELVHIKAPTLILWGEKDYVLSLREANMLRAGVKGSRLRIVWGATHWPADEKPADVIRILREEGV